MSGQSTLRWMTVIGLLAQASPAAAAPVPARFVEGSARGFLSLRAAGSPKVLAHGELIQTARGEEVESRLTFRFADESLSDETVVFSARPALRLLRYRLIQRGPSFPDALEATLTRQPPAFTVRGRSRERKETSLEGPLEIPDDVANGMLALLLRHLRPGRSETVSLVAFTPKPVVLDVPLGGPTMAPVIVGGLSRQASLFALKPRLRGVARVIAPLIGKEPPVLRYWILADDQVPAFLGFEGPMFANGPVWTVDLTAPRWPSRGPAAGPSP